MTLRHRRLILLAHCILNQNAVVQPLAREPAALRGVLGICLEAELGLLQLPCPELTFAGPERAPAERHDYDTPEFRAHCRRLLEPTCAQVAAYRRAGYEIVGLIGIGDSPSCGLETTHDGGPIAGRGVFMQELLAMIPELAGRCLQVPRRYPQDPQVRPQFEAELQRFCGRRGLAARYEH